MYDDIMLIVQYRLRGFWGDDEEIERRDELAMAIDGQLQPRGLGAYDGKDTGGGASNLFFFIPPDRLEEALKVIVSQVEQNQMADRVIVARAIAIPKEPDPDVEHIVVWPSGFVGEFNIFRWSGGAE